MLRSPPTRVLLLLLGAIAVVYGQVVSFEFVHFDDPLYVTQNAWVRRGLSFDGVLWALTTAHASNWHPLTWISHMLDVELFGFNSAGHHVMNVVLHAANSVLVYTLLYRTTGFVWRSGFVAALFALHPLHVESVAWISERKDVLSTFFGLAAILTYVRYVRGSSKRWYAVTLGLFALSLMSKPMLVTLPFVLMVFDYWPLARMDSVRQAIALIPEKIPLLALAVASSVATFAAQRAGGAMQAAELVPLDLRLLNAAGSYGWYAVKMVWPTGLAVLYPHPYITGGGTPWASWQLASAIVFLILGSAASIVARRRRYIAVGWLWYLGTLVPVIGLVQVGEHAMADRYSYVPLIGLFIAGVWSVADLAGRAPWSKIAPGAAVAAILACAVITSLQLRTWANSVVLFERALEVDSSSRLVLNNLAWVLATHPDPGVRDGARAVELAERASDLTGGRSPGILDTLAAAHAETGDFFLATKVAERAARLAARSRNREAAHDVQRRVELYQRGEPYRELPPEAVQPE